MISIFLFLLFAICSSAIQTKVYNVDGDSLHLKAYTNEIQNIDKPYKYAQSDYFKPITRLTFTDKPVSRYYQFTLKKVKLRPDGFERTVWSVNGQHPGPIIQVNKGDRIIVNVTNEMGDHTAVHWHGLHQRSTNWYDGVPGQTQCPIPNLVSLNYNFSTAEQYGTYWYHSHFFAQYVDGLRGSLIIHDPDDPFLNEYDAEYIVPLTDWFHRTTGDLLTHLVAANYTGFLPIPDSPLISGRGKYNCASALPGSKCSKNQPLAVYNVKKNQKLRLRIINTAANGFFIFSIDHHKLKVIESDGIYVKSSMIEKLSINVGQRYSVIVDANQPIGNYWIRALLDPRCIRINNETINFNSSINWTARGILHYEGAKYKPSSKDFNKDVNPCHDLDQKHLKPLHSKINYDDHVTDFFNITIRFKRDYDAIVKAYINENSFVPHMNDPTINKITRQVPPEDLPKEQNSLILNNKNGLVDIYIHNNSTDAHPFHMHGHVFAILFVGDKDQLPDKSKYNTKNPVIRDTASVPSFGYMVVRFISDNPGIWAYHCHMEWHVEEGMVIQLVELPKILSNETIPENVNSLCLKHDFQKKRDYTLLKNRQRFNPITINEFRSDITI